MLLTAGVLLLVLSTLYALALSAFAVGFQRVKRNPRVGHTVRSAGCPSVSVVIAARNEVGTIAQCLDAIFCNDYPADRFEVIVVDDFSEDDTDDAVMQMQRRLAPSPHRLQLVRMSDSGARAHKKRAIAAGIAKASGTLILTTDADCTVPPSWITTLVATFESTPHSTIAFVAGPARFRDGRHPLLRMQALEFLGLIAVGAGAIGAGRPILCSGTNVAYRRAVFDCYGGFSGISHLTSGDDELLMQKIHDTTPYDVQFCASPQAMVVTEPCFSLRAFLQQRQRWASKGAHYPNKRLVAFLVAVYLFYLSLLLSLLALPVVPALWPFVLGALGLKMLSEVALLVPAVLYFGQRHLLPYFFPAQLLHIPYVVVLGAAGSLGHYEWKGRRVPR